MSNYITIGPKSNSKSKSRRKIDRKSIKIEEDSADKGLYIKLEFDSQTPLDKLSSESNSVITSQFLFKDNNNLRKAIKQEQDEMEGMDKYLNNSSLHHTKYRSNKHIKKPAKIISKKSSTIKRKVASERYLDEKYRWKENLAIENIIKENNSSQRVNRLTNRRNTQLAEITDAIDIHSMLSRCVPNKEDEKATIIIDERDSDQEEEEMDMLSRRGEENNDLDSQHKIEARTKKFTQEGRIVGFQTEEESQASLKMKNVICRIVQDEIESMEKNHRIKNSHIVVDIVGSMAKIVLRIRELSYHKMEHG